MEEPIRVGIIGLGRSGWNIHYNTIRRGAPLAVTLESVRKRIAVLDKCHKMCGL